MKNKIVLAYSGGLDTSYCIRYLKKQEIELHAVFVQTGGFSKSEISIVEEKALALGADTFICLDATEAFYNDCIKYLIFGNVLRNHTYPLSVSAERVFQALEIVHYAKKIDATAIAHGSTGAGNDQVRFDSTFQIVAPEIEIITPIRDQQLSRQEEIDFLQTEGFGHWDWSKAKYSINKGLWGTSVGGAETLSSHLPLPSDAYPSQLKVEDPTTIKIHFENGELTGLDGQTMRPLDTIKKLNAFCEQYAIGRDIHVGDTIIGLKGRVGFEAGGPLLIIKAHQLLEKHTLSKWQQYWKDQLATWYGMQLHEAQFLEPLMRNIEVFLSASQERVSGHVHVRLLPYQFLLDGVESPNDLMQAKYGQYGEMNTLWDADEAKGFIKLISTAAKIYHND